MELLLNYVEKSRASFKKCVLNIVQELKGIKEALN